MAERVPESVDDGAPDGRGDDSAAYGADQIEVLEGLDPVRRRPGMYVGGTNARALHHLVYEVVDNSVDEALAGHCTEISVELAADGSVMVVDDGRGIPTGIQRETGVSALELVFTRLHAGGKFGSGGYKVSGGLHGVGASVTNALSEWLEVEVRRDDGLYRQTYARGLKTSEVELVRALARGEGTGTTVRFRPDATIFDRDVRLSPSTIATRLREKAYLVRGLRFRLRTHGPDGARDEVFESRNGLADYVRELAEERQPSHPHVISIRDAEAETPVEVALQWTAAADDRIYSFCNVVNTVDGGTHVTGLRRALTRAVSRAAVDAGRLRKDRNETLDPKDVVEGLTAAVSVMLAEPQFEGQTKGRLNNQEAVNAVADVVNRGLSEWFAAEGSRKDAKAVLDRVLLAREIRIARSRVSKKLRNAATSIFSDSNLPGKLADTLDNPNVPIGDRELFIVEGDSAGGIAKGARDVANQAILPIRGKILNVLGAKNGRAFENSEVDSILVALGGRKDAIGKTLVATLDAADRRYGKVVITADADADGAHIGNLLITVFHELFPTFLAEGRVFLARPPLFRVRVGGEYRYVADEAELKTLQRKIKAGSKVTRFKGLGEMNAEHLRETVFAPETRRLLQVTVEDAAHVAETVNLLMGSHAAPRRTWLEEHAPGAEVEV